MRNLEKDEEKRGKYREKLLATAFTLFSKESIESVKFEDIAKESNIGAATVYRYFGSKPEMVIELATKKWIEHYKEVEEYYQKAGGDSMNAAEELEFFLDSFINLYRNHKDLLRFNRNFDTYVIHEKCTEKQMKPYNDAVSIFAEKFHTVYKKAQEDGTLSIKVSEKKLFVNIMYIMLSVAGKYAEGLVYPPHAERDMTEELFLLKHMIFDSYAKRL